MLNLNKKLIALAVPATLALAAGGMVAAYAATPTPPSPTAAAENEANEPAEATEAPKAPGAPEVGHADDPKNATADHQFEGEE
jgi:hypothetical protein